MVLCQLLGIIIRICSKRFLPDKPLDGFYLPYLNSTVGCGFTGLFQDFMFPSRGSLSIIRYYY